MIFDTMENFGQYRNTIPFYEEIKEYIKKNPLRNIPEGKHEIIGNKLFVISSQYTTTPEGPLKGELEAHRKYIDLQIMIEGEEKVRYTNLKDLINSKEYSEEKDVEFLKPQFDISELYLHQGKFAVFFPEDAHEPGGAINNTPIKVKKAVFKISKKDENTEITSTLW